MNPILHGALLIFFVGVLRVEHFGFVQEFMVKAQDFLVLAERRLVYGCHFKCKVRSTSMRLIQFYKSKST